jgi:hypothetical protein
MSNISNRIYEMASRRLKQEGQILTYSYVIIGSDDYDPATGTNVVTPAATFQVYGIFLDYNNINHGLMTKTGQVIEKNDKQLYMAGCDIDGVQLILKPSPTGDTITDIHGTVWRIKNVKEYNPTGSKTGMYDMLVTR